MLGSSVRLPVCRIHAKKLDTVFRYALRVSGFQDCEANHCVIISQVTSYGETPRHTAVYVIFRRLVNSVCSLRPPAFSAASHPVNQRFRIIRTTKKEIDAHIEEISNAGQVAQGERSRAAHFVGKGLLMHTESGSKVALRNSVLPE